MSEPPNRYSDWKAPGDDGQTLVWPTVPELLRQTLENQRRLDSCDARIQGMPLGELRTTERKWLGHTDGPLVGAGHQVELLHPGVWAKNILINCAARELGGSAFHFAVDTDAPKHLHLRWPGASLPITDDPALASAAWSGLLSAPSPSHLAMLESRLAAASASWSAPPAALAALAHMRSLALESDRLGWVLVNAIHHIDWGLGLRHQSLLASPIWLSPGYLALVHHVAVNIERFAASYNGALGEHRLANGIKAPGRPWPDLRVSAHDIEAPFWLDDVANGTRVRAAFERRNGLTRLLRGDGEAFTFDPAAEALEAADALARFLRQRGLVLSPRALALTLFFRTLVCDQFVHGIGGGRYDQVTDRVIETFFGFQAPAFCVTTATLYFPAALGQRRVNLHPLLQEGRRIRHGALSAEKRRLVGQIESAPRQSSARQHLFYEMHARLAAGMQNPALSAWERRFHEAQRIQAEQRALYDRELFFAVQPTQRLLGLVATYQSQFQRQP